MVGRFAECRWCRLRRRRQRRRRGDGCSRLRPAAARRLTATAVDIGDDDDDDDVDEVSQDEGDEISRTTQRKRTQSRQTGKRFCRLNTCLLAAFRLPYT